MSAERQLRSRVAGLLQAAAARLEPTPDVAELPFDGYTEGRTPTPYLDMLTDDQIRELNTLLPWQAYTVDGKGRRVGNRFGSRGKKETPQVIPDRRVVLTDETFDLGDKHVLEIGCLEGLHTIGLCQRARSVTAVDISLRYAVKTIVRSAFFGQHPDVFVCDVERWDDDDALRSDVVFHSGVLYHLADPVRHLLRLGRLTRCGMLLDTHVADPAAAVETMEVDGETYRYEPTEETPGYASEVFSRRLPLDDLVAVLERAGFERVTVVEDRDERNGPRVALLAHKSPTT